MQSSSSTIILFQSRQALPLLNTIISKYSSSGTKMIDLRSQPISRSISSSSHDNTTTPILIPTTKTISTTGSTISLSVVLKTAAKKQRRSVLTTALPSSSSLPVMVCDALEQAINEFMEPTLRPSVDPTHVLAGNFSPVSELPPTDCPEIEGELPACLDGAYIRNGPNPQHYPTGSHHLFEGDGMLHCLRIFRGHASFCSRYVRTYKYTLEQQLGSSVIPKFFSGFCGLAGVARVAVSMFRVLTGQYDPRKGIGLANTSLAYFGGMLLALCECDLPYSIYVSPDDGDILTIGRHDFDKRLSMWMTAHPKKDPDTGEMFAFRCGLLPPFLTYFVFDADGTKRRPDVPIFSNTRRPSFVHDFAITKKYALFCDIQLGISGLGGASPITCDPGKVSRIGVLPRYATDESQMRWFDVPGFNMMHSINAWDDDDDDTSIVLIAPNILMIEHILEDIKLIHCSMEKVRIDLKSGTVSRTQLSERNLELGAINPAYLTKRNRYAYMGLGESIPKISGVVKMDLELGKTVATRVYGPGCFGGEPFFVPSSSGQGMNEEEDDGYVVSYVHDEVKGESKFLVLDAKSPELDVVASVKLPRRVPYGFHGLFVSEDELKKQRPVL
ncbi:hypothetical protein QJS04_geneDACA022806 [Acorus gramineus]|uniref:Uncharacterized protein n=1 Tax=Acorus gramineus TaxID=55184 RepID=A0AAV9B3V5_ACOGR|nr:hypothetical protein QJS04_geneDACA022806 [Acorus gramineus]